MSYILALDQGTTSSRAIIFDEAGQIFSTSQKEYAQIFPKNGWVEHNPLEIWESQRTTAVEVLKKADLTAKDIAAVGITNQRETTVCWNRKTGAPIYNAIVWQDRRTSAFCDDVRGKYGDLISAKTGLEIDAYFSASKIRWIFDNVSGARAMAERASCFLETLIAGLFGI